MKFCDLILKKRVSGPVEVPATAVCLTVHCKGLCGHGFRVSWRSQTNLPSLGELPSPCFLFPGLVIGVVLSSSSLSKSVLFSFPPRSLRFYK